MANIFIKINIAPQKIIKPNDFSLLIKCLTTIINNHKMIVIPTIALTNEIAEAKKFNKPVYSAASFTKNE